MLQTVLWAVAGSYHRHLRGDACTLFSAAWYDVITCPEYSLEHGYDHYFRHGLAIAATAMPSTYDLSYLFCGEPAA